MFQFKCENRQKASFIVYNYVGGRTGGVVWMLCNGQGETLYSDLFENADRVLEPCQPGLNPPLGMTNTINFYIIHLHQWEFSISC